MMVTQADGSKEKMETAVIYARQSSGSDDYSESVEVQIRNCRNLAASSNLNVLAIFQDLNVSGKTYPEGWEVLAQNDFAFQKWFSEQTGIKRSRKGLGELFRFLPQTDYIIVDEITRLYRPLTRSFLEAAVNQRLIEHHVRILQVKGGMLDLAQFDQQLITMLKNQINDEQIAKQRQKSIEVLNRLRDSGVMPTGVTAWGLRYEPGCKRISADPEKIPVVQYIFDALDRRLPYNQIIQEVNLRWPHLFRSCFWEKSLYLMAAKPIYAGYQYNTAGELIKNRQWDGVISVAQWLRVQEVMKERRLTGGKTHCNYAGETRHWLPLSGLLYCGVCGSRLVTAVDRGKVAYFCQRGYFRGTPECRGARIMVDYDKPELVGLLQMLRQVLPLGILAREKRLNALRREQSGENEYLERLSALENKILLIGRQFAAGELPESVYRKLTAELAEKIETMRRKHLRSGGSETELRREDDRLLELRRAIRKKQVPHEVFEELLRQALRKVEVHADIVRLIPNMDNVKLPDLRRIRKGKCTGFSRSELIRLWRWVRTAVRQAAPGEGGKLF